MLKLAISCCAAFVLGAAGMAMVDGSSRAAADQPKADNALSIFQQVRLIIENRYVTPQDERGLTEAALKGMVTSLDPHSEYLSATEYRDSQSLADSAGVGLVLTSDGDVAKLVSTVPGSPAAKADLQSGDRLIAIDGTPVVGQPFTQTVGRLHGQLGQPIDLLIDRAGRKFEVKLVRVHIEVIVAKTRMIGGEGYLRISAFDKDTEHQVTAALSALKAQNPTMKGLIVDLRNNPGGLLSSAADTTGLFLDGGEIVTARGRDPKDIQRFNARTAGDLLHGLPVVVLVNSGTASGAEVMAAALQDRRQAQIVGLPSFGNGSVQTVIPVSDGVDGVLKLTTSLLYRPSGSTIERNGVEPDFLVAATDEQARAFEDSKFQFSERSYSNSLRANGPGPSQKVHRSPETPPPGFDVRDDFQLARAIAVLHAKSANLSMQTRSSN